MSNATWIAVSPFSGDFNDPSNWDTGVVPDGTAFFSQNGQNQTLIFRDNVTIGTWSFTASFAQYKFPIGRGLTVDFTGTGIVMPDPLFTVVRVDIEVDRGGLLEFSNSSTAGRAAINTVGDTGARILFLDHSTAGNATIANDAGLLSFGSQSSAANATLTNNSVATFAETSTAGSATIANNASLLFANSSRAGKATISNAGFLNFLDNSTGDAATIANNAGATLNFGNTSTAGGAGAVIGNDGLMQFHGDSTGGRAAITNRKTLQFLDHSSAGDGSAAITNLDQLRFDDESSAGGASIVNDATMRFFNDSTAGSASITNHSVLRFLDQSAAGSAEITNDSLLQFFGASTAGGAQLINNAGGTVDFSTSTGPAGDHKLSAGSIAGAGSYHVGANALTVGGNDLSTVVSGVIDGVSGSLVKIGAGTLTLTGADTYTGPTTVIGGVLQVDGSIVSAVTVDSGGALHGNGTTGAVTVASGGTLAPGDSPGLLHTGDLALAAGAHFAVELGGTAAGIGGYDQIDVTGAVDLGGATLDLALTGGFNPAAGSSFEIIENDGADAVSGTFAGLAEGASVKVGGATFSISYHGGDGNDVTLTAGASQTPVNQPPVPVNGTAGHDNFIAPSGDASFIGLGGTDGISFNFKLTDATITFSGNQIIIDGPNGSSHTVTNGIEVFNFTDGTVNERDGNPLVDDLFYYAQNHDVWLAHMDADAHFAQFGWKEGRNPNAFFDTKGYLAHYTDVAAAGINPLLHYDQFGWREGRDPSVQLDTKLYESHYPDVAAAHVDPLAHFLAVGAEEQRTPFSDGVWG
jgi:autotransporter-associated beta strand protein